MVMEKPRLLFKARTERKKPMRRFLWGTLAGMSGLAIYALLPELYARSNAISPLDPAWLTVGQVFAVGVFGVFTVRALFALGRGFRLPSESLRLFDRGFTWERRDGAHKYAWRQLKTYHERFSTGSIGRWKLWQWGEIRLVMGDNRVFRLRPYHGDLRQIAQRLRPIAADEVGTRMARALRDGKTVHVYRDLTLSPQGVRARGRSIRWQDVDIATRRGRLVISQQDKKTGKFRPVARYPLRRVENLPGLLEVAQSTIQNYQPQRFGIETQVGKVYREPSRR